MGNCGVSCKTCRITEAKQKLQKSFETGCACKQYEVLEDFTKTLANQYAELQDKHSKLLRKYNKKYVLIKAVSDELARLQELKPFKHDYNRGQWDALNYVFDELIPSPPEPKKKRKKS